MERMITLEEKDLKKIIKKAFNQGVQWRADIDENAYCLNFKEQMSETTRELLKKFKEK